MAGDQTAVERDPGVEHVLIEGGEALPFRLDAVAEQRKFLELEVFLLLEQEPEPQPDPQRERQAQPLGTKVVALNRA